jgi:hypothetical protein
MRRTRISMLCAALLAAMPASAEAGGLGSVVGAVASVPQTLLGGLFGGGRARQSRQHARHTKSDQARHTKSERSAARAAPAAATAAVAPSAAAAAAPPAPAVTPGAVEVAPAAAPATPSAAAVAPAETKPSESKPAETKPAETKLVDRGNAVFWPSAYDDVFGYVVSSVSYGDGFWLRGYADVVEGMFAPSAAAAPRDKRGRARAAEATNTDVPSTPACVEAPKPDALIERIEQIVRPSDAQRQALRELGNALQAAAERIGVACATDGSGGPNARLETMWRRLRAMRQAVTLVRTPLRNFYDALNEEQRTRLDTAAAVDPNVRAVAAREASDRFVRMCSESTRMPEWPLASIAQTVKLDGDQRPMLELLMGTSMHYAHELRASCSAAPAPITSTERLEAVDQRLGDIIYAVTVLRGMLNRFYNSLTQEQRARFDAMAPGTRPTDRRRADLH